MDHTIAVLLAIFTLTLISMGVFLVAQRYRVPYTVLLVFVGLLLVPLTHIPFFAFIAQFQLTPDILFFVFLPVLIFEAAYNMSIPKVAENLKAISLLAVGGLLISAFFVAFAGMWAMEIVGVHMPFLALLLFGAIISATDPVAVLALFKEYGAPRRLALLFEGESLFNDGTAVALFLVVLSITQSGVFDVATVLEGVGLFTMMVVSGVIFGLIMGGIFSKILQYADSEHVHITLTMLVAHFTFLLAEIITHAHPLGLHISSIIATVVAAMVVGNYGRYKLAPRVERYMQRFWDYFAFVANSLVFVLMGLIFANISIDVHELVVPLVIIITVVIVARMISVYGLLVPFNYLQRTEKTRIPPSWQHLMAWGSLRGALAITMALLIPHDLTIAGWTLDTTPRDFILALTIGCIYFTLFIKATTIPLLIHRLKIDKLHPLEEVEYWEGKVHVYATALMQLAVLHKRERVDDVIYKRIHKRLTKHYNTAKERLQERVASDVDIIERVLRMYAIGIEKRTLQSLYTYGEISERAYKKVLGKMAVQRTHLEDLNAGIVAFEHIFNNDVIERGIDLLRRVFLLKKRTKTAVDRFMYYRALMLLAREVVEHITMLMDRCDVHFAGHDTALSHVLNTYKTFEKQSEKKMHAVLSRYPKLKVKYEELMHREVLRAQEEMLDDLFDAEMITPKLRTLLREEFRAELVKQ